MSDFLELFRARADAGADSVLRMPFDRFMALALYDPELGYYRRDRKRVGRGEGTDFFTASTSGPVFGELICAAAEKLLREQDAGADLRDYVFVEIGAEPGGGVLAGVAHPFARASTIRVGEAVAGNAALTGKCVVFSNELFDAQPFRRFVFRGGAWRELGVALDARAGALIETELPAIDGAPPLPPAPMPGGWHLDLPLAASALAREIAAQPWSGLFLACDYGKSWRELLETTPAGTARAYHRHTQSNDLLAHPGEQDLTCHICWDWLAEALAENGFSPPRVESQEAFFVRHAGKYLENAFAEDAACAAGAGSRKRSLMQLLHPAHMGQKFQALHGFRTARV
ncbi:SAM-dependent MidA family methyltransferase [Ereboglobus sp. PH5-10]|uniref:SAM-dependent methyltransferase n=1 Tax=Ereboglobus sp. PH5-10 TaxID=2940629 RepID=UPI0024069A06|nr:SAM-dependent methyltransferase [Ereboglobus sp. PH5-10]MDF9826992.1 SAM-dependent MidA family methyltransferase [Ereboglobus sp. PH5-10]